MNDFTVYGPYTRSNGRRLVIVVDKNGKRRTVSYPKWLLEQQLKRKLDPDKETVDHIDSDLHNNDLSNLRIMPRDEHSKEDTRRVKWIDFTCPWCDKTFSRSPRLVRDKAKKNRSGPFCSRNCAGKYSRMLQLKLIDKMAPQPYIISEYFKKKNVTASVDEDDSDDIFIEDLLALASNDFIYHEAKREDLSLIKEDGLYAKGAELKTYVLENEPEILSQGSILLRFSKDVSGAINKDAEPYILREILPEAIEVKINDSWYPLIS